MTAILHGPNGEVSSDHEVADLFNAFFVKKIEDLKEKIDPNQLRDPLEKVKEKVRNKSVLYSKSDWLAFGYLTKTSLHPSEVLKIHTQTKI